MTNTSTISKFMATNLITLTPDMEIVKAMSILLNKKISGAPVVNEKGALIGVLSKKDCLRASLNASYHQEWGGRVCDYMSEKVKTLDVNMDLVEAAEYFLKTSFRRFPVLSEGQLVGQISRADLLHALSKCW